MGSLTNRVGRGTEEEEEEKEPILRAKPEFLFVPNSIQSNLGDVKESRRQFLDRGMKISLRGGFVIIRRHLLCQASETVEKTMFSHLMRTLCYSSLKSQPSSKGRKWH